MNKIYKAVLAAAAVTAVATVIITPASVNAWGDSSNGRPSYTVAEINAGKLGDKITLNSISDSKFGDEKNFVAANLNSSKQIEDWKANEIKVKDGDVVTVRLYVHNNSPKGMAKIAEGVKATFAVPTAVAKSHTIVGYLDSTNATPNRYWDEVVFKADNDFYLEYVNGSAAYTNSKMGTVKLSNSVITSGAMLGYDKLDGKIPGCYEYDGYVTIQVKVHQSVSAKLSKTVRIKGTKNWSESVNAKVGDEVEYQIEYVNLLNSQVNNVVIADALPTNMEYVQNSTYLYNAQYQNGVQLKDNTLTTTGINIGSYTANGNAYVRFTAKVVDKSLKCGDNQLVNWAQANANSKITKDDASVMVKKTGGTCDTPTPTPPTPPTPDPEPTPTPGPLPNTGASEIALGALGVGGTVTAAGYYIASRKKLMK